MCFLRYNPIDVIDELPIFIEPGKFKVLIDPTNLELNSEIDGGILNHEYKEIAGMKKKYMDALKELSLEAPDQFEVNYARMIKLGEEFEKSKMDFSKNNPHSPISIYLLENRFSMLPLNEQKELLSNFNPSVYHMNLYKKYKADYENQVKLLDFTPVFSLNDQGIEKMEVDFSKTTILKTLVSKNLNKPMYIDVWGTWCGPCISSFPKIRSLQEKFNNKDLIFVYLCVRSREEVWTKMIKEQNLIGQHYLFDNDLLDRLYREAKIGGFPSYILINREGNVCLNAPKPQSENIEQVLRSL